MASSYGFGKSDADEVKLPPSRRRPSRRRDEEDEYDDEDDRPRRSRRGPLSEEGSGRPRPNFIGLGVGFCFLGLGMLGVYAGVKGRSFGYAIGFFVAGILVIVKAAAGEE